LACLRARAEPPAPLIRHLWRWRLLAPRRFPSGALGSTSLEEAIAMEHARRTHSGIATALAIAHCLGAAGCQPSLGGVPQQPSSGRLPFVAEFKKIDTAGRGRITLEQTTAYYTGLFAQLDKNGDGFLDASELEAMVPAMDTRSGKELLQKLDRNSDSRLSQPEFLIIVNWLFQLASSPNELALGDVEKGS